MPLAPTPRWQTEVPGTRWFRADLHIHTLDDPSRDPPPGLVGDRTDSAFLEAYARHVLDAAVDQGIEVLGLTPHSAYVQVGQSAVLAVRDLWRSGTRTADAKPYRELLFAVFPGFEPNFQDGVKGIHLLFLFDPEVERDRYLNAFTAVMGGRQPYSDKSLQRTTRSPKEAFACLDDPKALGHDAYVVVAPHPTQQNGIFHRPGDDIPDLVGDRVLALELSRSKTLEEDLAASPRLHNAYRRGRALLHNSDANRLPAMGARAHDRELGQRFTLLKLAAPTLSALRQAFLARDARTRLPFVRGSDGTLQLSSDLPAPCPVRRPWLRQATVVGGTSFHRGQTFRFSPDLTCIIGGSMTGKSTLLDGLRLRMGGEAGLPDPRSPLYKPVRERASNGFLSGNAQVDLDSPAGDLTLPVEQHTAMRFFSQGELKSLSDDEDSIEDLLFHLVPGRAEALVTQRADLADLDGRLRQLVSQIVTLQEQVGEAEEELQRTQRARDAIARFDQVGAKDLPLAQQDRARTHAYRDEITRHADAARELHEAVEALSLPELNHDGLRSLAAEVPSAADLTAAAAAATQRALADLSTLQQRAEALADQAETTLRSRTEEVEAALVAAGGSAEELNVFGVNARAAQHFDSFQAVRDQRVGERDDAQAEFDRLAGRREVLAAQHRAAMQGVCEAIAKRFKDRVLVAVKPEGRKGTLQDWIQALRNPGLTRWWNNAGRTQATSTGMRAVAHTVEAGDRAKAVERCVALGLSETVASTLIEVLSKMQRRLEVQALRSPDRYELQWVEDGQPKRLDELSGGRKVAVLLSLVLESDDPTPLVVDQPEDELDNRFLNETIIPALHRLKGKRQVIFATHNANIVVNGDADQVLVLEADAHHGRVAVDGAIEDERVRDAILRTLDGGEEAFRLRRSKYGF